MLPGFKVLYQDKQTRARIGRLQTSHGSVTTPSYIPDATYGAVKHLTSQELNNTGLEMILANSYHLWLRPGTGLIKKFGGLHQFMNWSKPILTDSGGWQVFSLVYQNQMGRVLVNGVEFQDHLSGQTHLLTPAKAINNQLALNSDILMVLDYPVAPKPSLKDNQLSVKLTSRWAKQSHQAFINHPQAKTKLLMAIIQGANSKKLRKQSFNDLEAIYPFPGYGFGGPLPNDQALEYTAQLIPNDRLRYVMGCGRPQDLVKTIAMGWDLFDCVIPTRNARHGLVYTFKGKLRLLTQKFESDQRSIEPGCSCLACQHYSRAYIRHLLKVKEPLGQRLTTIHNLSFYMQLLKQIKIHIKAQTYAKFMQAFLKYYP